MPVFSVQQSRRPTPAEPNAAEFLRWSKISCEAWVGMSPADRIGWARSYYYLSVLGGNAPPPYSEVAITKLVDQTNESTLLGACPILAEPAPRVAQAIHRPQNPMGVIPPVAGPAKAVVAPVAPRVVPSGTIQMPKYGVPLIVAAVAAVGIATVVYAKRKKRR